MSHKILTTPVAIKRRDGGIALMHISTHKEEKFGDETKITIALDLTTEEREAFAIDGVIPARIVVDEIAKAFESNPEEVVAWRQVSPDEIPASREFREALADDGVRLHHDMEKARAIHLGRVRAARNDRLDALDRDWMRATGQKNEARANSVEAERQRLRDLPAKIAPAIESATTVDELSAIGQ